MPFDKDPTTDPDFIERQYRAGNNSIARYNMNIELAEQSGGGFGRPFGAPLFGGWGQPFISKVLFQPPGPRRVDPDIIIED